MTNFAHVENALIRSVLLGYVNDDAIRYALDETRDALMHDQVNPDVNYKVLAIRESAIEEAELCWHDGRDMEGTLNGLRRFWNN